MALQADQQSLVEFVYALDDLLDRGVVGRQLPFQDPRQERGRVEPPSSLPPDARSRKSSRKGTASACEVITQASPTRAHDRERLDIVGVDERGDLDAEGAAVIVGRRLSRGLQEVGLRVARDAQPLEQGRDVLVRRSDEIDPQQLMITEPAGIDLSDRQIAIPAMRVEERDLHPRLRRGEATACSHGCFALRGGCFAVSIVLLGYAGGFHVAPGLPAAASAKHPPRGRNDAAPLENAQPGYFRR